MRKFDLFIVLGLIVALATACFGQDAENPDGDDRQGVPELRAAAEVIPDDLQAYLDGPAQILDAGGKIFHVTDKWIPFTVQHHGKHLKNCEIHFHGSPQNSVGWMLFIQGRTWSGKWYYPGKIDFTLENVKIYGDFIPPTSCQDINEMLADQAGKGQNLISNVTFKAGVLTLKNVEIYNSGNSAIAMSADGFDLEDVKIYDAAKHGLGLRGSGGTQVKMNRVTLERCGGSIDFHNEGDFFVNDKPDQATVNELKIINPRGRSKIAGANWEVTGTNWEIRKDTPISVNAYPAFDCARRPRKLDLDNVAITNFPQMGLRWGPDTFNVGSPLSINHVVIDTSMYVLSMQQPGVRVQNTAMLNYRNPWTSGQPGFTFNVTAAAKRPDIYWAQTFDACEEQLKVLNTIHGTNVIMYYTVPGPVAALMEHK